MLIVCIIGHHWNLEEQQKIIVKPLSTIHVIYYSESLFKSLRTQDILRVAALILIVSVGLILP